MAFSNPKKNDRSLKRGRTEVLSKEKVFETFPKFLVIHSDNDKEPITSKSVFKIAKSLERSIGKEYQAKNLASGDLLIEVQTKAQSEELQKQKEIAEQSVTITPHRTLNCVQGGDPRKAIDERNRRRHPRKSPKPRCQRCSKNHHPKSKRRDQN